MPRSSSYTEAPSSHTSNRCRGAGVCDYCGIGITCGLGDQVVICTYTRGCYGGPACPSSATCTASGCVAQ